MGKRELKKQYKDLKIDIIDMIAKFDPTETNKLTPFLVKQFVNKVNDNSGIKGRKNWYADKVKPKGELEYIMSELVGNYIGGKQRIESMESFSEHLTNGRIKEKDILKYNTWSSIESAINNAEIKLMDKELSKQVETVYSDSEWLFIKPLSLKAAQTYGNGTKWCTSMKNEPTYFYRYSRDGILIYAINKTNGRKFGFYSSSNEFSVWDVKDRRVDSMETRIPNELLGKLSVALDLDKFPNNCELFSDEEKEQLDKILNGEKVMMTFDGPTMGTYTPPPTITIGGSGTNTGVFDSGMITTTTTTDTWNGNVTFDQPTFGSIVGNDSETVYNEEMVEEEVMMETEEMVGEMIEEEVMDTEEMVEEWSPRSADTAFGMGGDEPEPIMTLASDNWDEHE